jgi:HD-like signal output (HDOD) protein
VNKPVILFVDDEPHVLSGLRRALHPRRDVWNLRWADGGPAALDQLAGHRVDIIVTDMQMPGMDGAALLEQVRRRFPGTARIVLSGHADRASIIAAAGVAQQFVSKPCDPAALILTLESTLAARAIMEDPHLRSLVGAVANLPKPPAVYAELSAVAHDPRSSAADLARVVEQDLATAAELLKLVNSSFFGAAQPVSSIRQAVTVLGVDAIQALVLAGRTFRPAQDLPDGLMAADIAGRGLEASRIVRRTGSAEGWDDQLTERLSLAALLYDVGLLELAASRPEAWARYRELRRGGSTCECAAQEQAFGVAIARVSAYLLGLWGFHPTVVSALAEQPIALGDDHAVANASPGALVVARAHRTAATRAQEAPAA